MKKHAAAVRSTVFLAVVVFAIGANAETLLWYRFNGDGAKVENKANPGTMDGTLKSINTWGSLNGLGDTTSKFPTRGDAFPDGTRLIDPATDTIHSETVKSLSFSGDPANSGTVRLLKDDATAALKEMMSCTCEVFFKLPSDSAAIETRRAKDILFPLVEWGSPTANQRYGWFFGLRKDSSTTGFYPAPPFAAGFFTMKMIRLISPADSIRTIEEILTEKMLISSMAAKAQSMNARGIGFFCIF